MAFFYATAEDLLPVLLSVENKIRIKYTPFDHFKSPIVKAFASALELPTLSLPAPFESAATCPKYLVTHLDATVKPRKISRHDGKTVWSIDQLENDESTVFSHGGLFGEDVLLYGEVRTVHKNAAAQTLQRAFDTAIRISFTKIQSFRVGKHAETLLDAGVRLTGAKQSPRTNDLAR
jgi:hypothetical protein